MNNDFANYYYDYIGATGTHTISDYIDYTSNILNDKINTINIINSNVNSNIISLSNQTYHINSNNPMALVKSRTYSGIPHTYIINSNINGEIRFNTYFSYTATDDPINNYAVKIDSFGKLYVYHKYNILQPTFPAGWYDLEGEVLALKADGINTDAQLSALEVFQYNATNQITALQALTGVQQVEIVNLQEQVEMLGFVSGNEMYLIQGAQNFETLRTAFGRFSQLISQNYKDRLLQATTVGIGLGIPMILSSATDYMNREYYYRLASNFSNAYLPSLTTEQRRILYSCNDDGYNSNTSNYNYYTYNLGITQGFINSNIITTQFIPTLKSNYIGIGTNNPQENLHLHSPIPSTANYIRFTNAQSGVASTDGVYMGLDDLNPYTFTINSRTATGRIQIRTGDTTRATLKSNGCFGLGITDPQQLLSVAGKLESTNGNNDKIYFSYDSANRYRHRIYTQHDTSVNDASYIQFYNWRYGQGATDLGDKSVAIFHNKFTKFDGNRYFWINDRITHAGNKTYTDTPLCVFNLTPSSSSTLNDPQRVLALSREGTSGQTNGQTATFKLSRWENSSTNSRTRLDLDLSDNTNDDVNIMTMRSDGRIGIGYQTPTQKLSVNGAGEFTSANGNKIIFSYSGNDYKHRIYTQHNGSGDVNNHFDFYTWRTGQGVNDDGDRHCLRLSATHTLFPANFNKYFWINNRILDYGNNDYTSTPFTIFNQTASSSTILNDPQRVLALVRQGTSGQTYGQTATFKLSRWENSSVNSRTRLDLDLSENGNDDVNVARFYSDGAFHTKQITALSTNSLNIWGGTNGNLTFSTGNPAGEVMRINPAGNIGINTTAPRTKLDIYSGSLTLRASGESGSTYLYMATPSDTNNDALKCALICEGLGTFSRSKFHIALDKNANNSTTYNASLTNGVQFTLKYNGYGAFGNKNPFEDAVAPANFQFIHFGNSTIANVCDYNVVIHKSNGSGGNRHFAIGYDEQFYETIGDLGANNTASYWYSHLSMSYSAPDYTLQLFGNGNASLYGTLSQGSDIKIKKDIKTIDNALWKVKQLRGVYYTHIIEGTKNIGLIAQEVEGIIPEVVSYDERSQKKCVAYGNLIALLVNAIKEQQEIIDNQEKALALAEGRINSIEEILKRNNII